MKKQVISIHMFFVLLSLTLQLPVAQPIQEQEADGLFVIKRFKMSEDEKSMLIESLSSLIPETLADLPEWSRELGLSVEFDTEAGRSDTSCRIQGSVWEKGQFVYVKGKVYFGKTEFSIKAKLGQTPTWIKKGSQAIAEELAKQLMTNIVNGLVSNIRINVSKKFALKSGDARLSHLEEEIPAMLEDALSKLPQMTLIGEGIKEFKQQALLREEDFFNPYTNLKPGRLMTENYMIMGHFWEQNGQVRIETRCIRLETGETVSCQGTNLSDVNIYEFDTVTTQLAYDVRSDILKHIYLHSWHIANTIAVVGLPPTPDTKDNRVRTKYIVKAFSRKLKALNTSRITIIENQAKTEKYIDSPTDIWIMAAQLNVSMLLIVQYENYDDGEVTINVDLFDSDNPYTNVYSETKTGPAYKVKVKVDSILEELLSTLGVVDAEGKTATADSIQTQQKRQGILHQYTKKYDAIPVRRITKPHSIEIMFNRIITSTDGPLEYKENSSFAAYAFFPVPINWHPRFSFLGTLNFDRDHFQMGPIITWDWGNNTLENLCTHDLDFSVHLFSLFLTTKYSFFPERFINPYVGTGVGILWLRRIYGEEFNFWHAPGQIKPGLTEIIGFEFKLGRRFRFTVPSKFYFGLGSFETERKNDKNWNGGWLWGINIGIGLNFRW